MNSKQGVLRIIKTAQLAEIGDFYQNMLNGQYDVMRDPNTGYEQKRLPIIVTDDLIEEGDKVLHKDLGVVTIEQIEKDGDINYLKIKGDDDWINYIPAGHRDNPLKVIVDTPQIPQNILDAIVADKLKDGDIVSVSMKSTYSEYKPLKGSGNWTQSNKIGELVKLQEGKAIVSIPTQTEKSLAALHRAEVKLGKEEIQRIADSITVERSTSDIEEGWNQYWEKHWQDPVGDYRVKDAWKAAVQWTYEHQLDSLLMRQYGDYVANVVAHDKKTWMLPEEWFEQYKKK